MGPSVARHVPAQAIALAALLVAVACTTGTSSSDALQPSATASSEPAPTASPTDGARGSVRLSTDKQSYLTREAMTLRVHNEATGRIDVMGSLGALRGWRADGAQEPWMHGFKETTELLPVKPGDTIDLGPVSAPDRAGRHVLEISYLDPEGVRSAARTEIDVQAGTGTATRAPTAARTTSPGFVRLIPSKTVYAVRASLAFRVSNETKSSVWLRSSLGGLRILRLTASGTETWNHGLFETQTLLEIRAGQFVDLTQIPGPEKVGDYLALVTYYTGSGAAVNAEGRFSVR